MYYILGKKDEMIFQETIENWEESGISIREFGYKETFKQLEAMLEIKERLNYNVNLELLYYDLFIKCEV